MIFDTHAHYDDRAFDEDREAVLASLHGAGIGAVVDVSASVQSLDRVTALADRYDFIYAAVGLHPDEVGQHKVTAGTVPGVTAEEYAAGSHTVTPTVTAEEYAAGSHTVTPAVTAEEYAAGSAEAFVTGLTDGVVSRIRQLLTSPKVVSVGEIGLDYYWDTEPHDVQIACFKKQIEIAVDAGKPIIVHSRSAAADTLRVIEAMYGEGRPAAKMAKAEAERQLAPEEYAVVPGKEWVYRKAVPRGPGADLPQKGVIHAYAYSPEQAKIYTEMGFYLGIGGVLTYRNSRKLKKVVSRIPLERLVLETDCPYLTPEPHRGERNDSRYLREVVRAIAEIKETDEMTVEHVTWENACRLFSIVPS